MLVGVDLTRLAGEERGASPRDGTKREYADRPPNGGDDALFTDISEAPSDEAESESTETHVAGLLPPASDEFSNSLEQALADGIDLPTMAKAERTLITEALGRFDGNRRKTADALGISERTLYRKIKEFEDDG